ncbi:MAG: hypothetical protein SGJ15_12095 [Bacteroidota bacterium]|nr:hypothetical protein [Bacteroidota bacterium]
MQQFFKYSATLFLLVFQGFLFSQNKTCVVKVKITTEAGKVIELVAIKLNQFNVGFTNKYGELQVNVSKNNSYALSTHHLSFESYISQLKIANNDTISINIKLREKTTILADVDVFAINKPETLVGKPNYSIYDFDFYEDKLVLLTSKNELKRSEIKLTDYSGKEFMSLPIPPEAGEAQKFFHDYLGNTNVLCKDSILRIEISDNFFSITGITKKEYERSLKPVNDTANGNYYYNDQNPDYPAFNYYTLSKSDPKQHKLLCNVVNRSLMDLYNFEYYFLPPRGQLEARRLAEIYKVDKKVIAALMSGFTRSQFYEPLYAPIFILKDTLCLFNHYNDRIFHFNKDNVLIDSVTVNYHHPKNWRTWKKQLFVDDSENKVYALFKNGANVSLKLIDHQSGQIKGVHKFVNITADKIKLKDGYAYYIYRPFESTQEKFLYREVIRINKE